MIPAITSYINDHRSEMFGLLEELVCIQSGSRNKEGIDRVGQRIALEMEAMGFSCEFQKEAEYGNHLIARSPNNDPDTNQGEKQILITGHMDTVFPVDTAFNYYKEDELHCFGPGVADMKGGLVVGIFALKALCHINKIHKNRITFIFNSDEEIGSPSSRVLIQREAKKSSLAYVLEVGGLAGEIVTGRKGNMSLELGVEGEAGHAAFAGKDKASAILELAHKTIAIEKLNEPEKGISANVGTIEGGIGSNTIAQHAKAAIDFRFVTDGEDEILKTKIEKIVANQTIPRTSSQMTIKSSRPAMPQTPGNTALFNKIKNIADELKISVVSELRQGVSDANLIAKSGIPVIDGLGPIGAKDHSEDEYIEKTSLHERAVLFANILASI
ncbi:MAG: M20 family metallopeptidase [Desulfobacteraceae bacterium]|nr:M20 family metallopeptidase [Desulfobacteraceae bacterium]